MRLPSDVAIHQADDPGLLYEQERSPSESDQVMAKDKGTLGDRMVGAAPEAVLQDIVNARAS